METVPIITTLAEYQTRFWLLVGDDLRERGFAPHFISFDDRSCDMLNNSGFAVTAANDVAEPPVDELDATLDRVQVTNLAYWTSHERFAFGRADDEAMKVKLARSIIAAQSAITDAHGRGQPVMVQEVGGFLSVVGSWFAARSAGVRHFFIEPSFFRGRLLFREGDFAAPVIPADACAPHGADFSEYLRKTLEDGQIVIPKKDAHHYSAAWKKVINLRNARRFAEKAYDKYVLGKRQEFGFIGQHAATHVKALVNSRKLAGHYTSLDVMDDFLYFPLHVPGDIALTLRSPEYLDQLALVDYICRNLPDGTRLAIKEHPAMVGMMQPDRLKAMLRRYPRLALIDPGTNNYAVMRRARGIVTINSKTGAEAGLIGLPVIVLGDAFYREAPFAHALDNLVELPAALHKLINAEDRRSSDAARLDWFAGAWELSKPGELYVTGADEVRTFTDTLASYLRC